MTRLLFIDDHSLVREALMFFIRAASSDIEIVGATSVEEALAAHGSEAFQLILLDYQLQEISGLPAIATVQKAFPDTPLIVLSGAITLAQTQEALDNGVTAVLSKDIEGRKLWSTIEAQLGQHLLETRSQAPAGAPLSPREAQVAGLLASGQQNKEIARALGIADITTRLHMRQVFRKIGARNRADAVRILLERRLHLSAVGP